MKDYNLLKIKATKLRKKGLSYNEIKKSVKVAKSTLSLWLKNISLPPKYRKRLYTKQIQFLSLGARSQKERRAKEVKIIIKNAEKEVKPILSKEVYQLMGAALYWAEGSKNKMFAITNSDPSLILFMVWWLDKIVGISPNKLHARLNIYSQQKEKDIKKFWADLTGIKLENFGKSYIKPLSTGFKRNNLYYGTMRIEVPKSVNLKHRIFGWISGSLKKLRLNTGPAQRKWVSLSRVNRPINLIKPS